MVLFFFNWDVNLGKVILRILSSSIDFWISDKTCKQNYLISYWKKELEFKVILGTDPNLGIILREIIAKAVRVNELFKGGCLKKRRKGNYSLDITIYLKI